MDWPDELEAAEEIDIETRRGPDAPAHRTTIWSVVEAGDVFVRSLRGRAGRWYRELLANPDAVVHAGGEQIPVRATAASDDRSVQRASDALRRKYADSPYLDSMLEDQILDTTVRLDRR